MTDDRITITLNLTPDQLWALYQITHDAGGNYYEPNPADAHLFAAIAEKVNRAACIAKNMRDTGDLCASRASGICVP